MPSPFFDLAQDFIWRSARLIDRHMFAYHFCGGPKGPVLASLKAYQNPDGGFGNALEPDKRVPDSQPIDAEEALKYLNGMDMLSDSSVQAEILFPLCNWLQTITRPGGGIPFALPSANPYPHTPWMGADENPPAAINPTASITGYLLKSGIDHSWVKQAEAFCWQEIESSESLEFHTILPETAFLQNAADQQRAVPLLARLVERVRQSGVVEMDPNAGGYVHPPLHWASLPSSPFRPVFDHATLQAHLWALVHAQRPDGGWPISWDALSPAAEAEWRGKITVDNLLTLRAYQQEGFAI